MPCGLSSAPAVFQCLINEMLPHMLGKYVVAYIDNILIYSLDETTHVQHVKKVLSQLLKHQLYVMGKSVSFMCTRWPS